MGDENGRTMIDRLAKLNASTMSRIQAVPSLDDSLRVLSTEPSIAVFIPV